MKSKKDPGREIAKIFRSFGAYIRSEEVRALCRKRPTDFIRVYKFPWFDILLFLIFRCKECITSELCNYYSSIGWSERRVSRQAAFKAVKKLNPKVFPALISKFAELFYRSPLVKTYKGYILLAEDGTTLNMPATDESLECFGYVFNQHIKSNKDIKKATSRSAALYDVTNGLIINFVMKKFIDSELPIAISQLEESIHHLGGRAAIYLADRYYDSVELFSILESFGMKYCVRGKANFFKRYIEKMKSNDEWINVEINKPWFKRLKYDLTRERFSKDPWIKIRVVKYRYTYFNRYGVPVSADLIYFTNLSEEEFSADDISKLCAKRWQIETSYKTLKTDYEWERFFTKDCDSEICSIYAKVLFHNMNGIIRKELDELLEEEPAIQENENKWQYAVNIKQLGNTLRDENLCRYIRSGNYAKIETIFDMVVSLIHKLKVPVRPDRHYKRWGKVVSSGHPTRFRLDGRNWPNTVFVNGHLQTTKPF